MRRLALCMLVCAAATLSSVVHAAPASAACGEVGVFWSMNPAGSPPFDFGVYTGSKQEISMTQHSLDSCIGTGTGTYGTGQTSRILLGGVRGEWVEVGWGELQCGTPCYSAFVENGDLGHSVTQDREAYYCVKAPSSGSVWRYWTLQLSAASGSWKGYGYVNCEDGNPDHLIYNTALSAFGYSYGYADGEGFHHGSSPMGEVHQNAQYLGSDGVYHAAANVACRYDQDGFWDGFRISATSFRVAPEGSGTTSSCDVNRGVGG
jgi:hypothetical protein